MLPRHGKPTEGVPRREGARIRAGQRLRGETGELKRRQDNRLSPLSRRSDFRRERSAELLGV